MSHDTRSRPPMRPQGIAAHAPPTAVDTASAPLLSLLARSAPLAEVLAHLHQHALETTGGDCSLLLQTNPRSGVMQATSGFRLESLPTAPYTPDPEESATVSAAFDRARPTLVADARQTPELAARLGMPSLLLLPLVRKDVALGMLAIGFRLPPTVGTALRDPGQVADAFGTALDLARLRQADQLQHDIRELLGEFGANLSSTLKLTAALDTICHGANRLFGADRTSVWVHDRRAHHLALLASSDAGRVVRGGLVGSDDPLSPMATAMRMARAEIISAPGGDATSVIAAPLRGTRRALGAIVFEGVRVEPGGELDMLDRADELGRQLSSAIENVQLLEEVLRSRRELENTFDSITDLVIVCDRHSDIVHTNEAFAARVGSPRDQLVDRPLASVAGEELAKWMAEREAVAPGHATHAPETREVTDPRLKGTFIVTITDLLNPDRERVGSVVVARDLTPQTQLEAEREELRKRLTQSEKLAALGQFVAGIAHELNNPLQGVLGHLELLRATGAFPKHLRREVQTIYREADRAAKIVRNLLVFAGSRRLARRSVSVNIILQKVVSLRAAACRALDIEVVRHYDDKLPRVQSDPLLLHQAFLNIVMNAEQAIAAAGRPGRIEIVTSVVGDGHRIRVSVHDSGDGIPADALSRIFEPFYTTKEVGKGTGLGLAIAYGIVQEHGGQIAAANHPDGGAIFTVELPARSGTRA